jgi:hypothetical protein
MRIDYATECLLPGERAPFIVAGRYQCGERQVWGVAVSLFRRRLILDYFPRQRTVQVVR